jgi:hypothetical protein
MTTQADADKTMLDLLRRSFLAFFSCHHGPMPARIDSYDSTKTTVDVTPLIVPFLDGEFVSLPQLRQVQFSFPGTGPNVITWPIQVGELCGLLPQSGDIGPWKSTGAVQSGAKRRFSLTDIIAIPGARPLNAPLVSTQVDDVAMVLNTPSLIKLISSNADKALARADKTDARLDALETFAGAHVHPGVTVGGFNTGTAPGAPVGTTVASIKVFTDEPAP